MAVINVHPMMAGEHVVDGPGKQNSQGKEGGEEEMMKTERF